MWKYHVIKGKKGFTECNRHPLTSKSSGTSLMVVDVKTFYNLLKTQRENCCQQCVKVFEEKLEKVKQRMESEK